MGNQAFKQENRGEQISFEVIAQNNVENLRKLLSKNPELVCAKQAGYAPLGSAAKEGFNEIIELLLSFDADIESGHDSSGSSPLLLGIQRNHSTTCTILLRAGANSNSVNRKGFNI